MPESDPSDNSSVTETAERVGDDVRERIVTLAFGGDRHRYDAFIRTLREAIPPDVSVVLRGSAVTGFRWEDGAPFDAGGPGTSDLDLTLIGGDMMRHFNV